MTNWFDFSEVLAAVRQNGHALHHADVTLKSNYEIVMAAVKENGCALQYADVTLKSNFEIVLAAVQNNGYALTYADVTLKKNHEIVLAAVQQDAEVLEYADEIIKDDEFFLCMLLSEKWVPFGIIKKYASQRILDTYSTEEELLNAASNLIKG
jgi:hypothetical protein